MGYLKESANKRVRAQKIGSCFDFTENSSNIKSYDGRRKALSRTIVTSPKGALSAGIAIEESLESDEESDSSHDSFLATPPVELVKPKA